MLQQVLEAFERAGGPVSLDELSRELGVEPGALEGMITFLVRKGRLREERAGCGGGGPTCSCASHPGGCAFATPGPRTITLAPRRGA